jgi:hypothetical protein
MDKLPLSEKYSPKNINDIIGKIITNGTRFWRRTEARFRKM